MQNVTIKFVNKRRGKGVFAAQNFAKGETVLPYQKSRVFRASELPRHWTGKFRYCDRIGKDTFMIMQAPERFINHSCEPNVYIKNFKIIAMRQIAKGEEITFDYSINSDFPVAFACRCGSQRCRGVFGTSFFTLPKGLQKKYVAYLDTWFKRLYSKKLSKLTH